MEVHVNDNAKLLCIWLTKAEKQDSTIMQQLMPIYDKYRKLKYKVAEFHSGDGDLLHNTQSLLLHNRYLNAKTK